MLGALFGLRRRAAGLPLLGSSVRLTAAVLVRVRHIGLPLLGLAFFDLDAVLHRLWAANPNEAFGGLDERPRVSDFFY